MLNKLLPDCILKTKVSANEIKKKKDEWMLRLKTKGILDPEIIIFLMYFVIEYRYPYI